MKVYTVTGFEGQWPIGNTAALVVAKDKRQARKLLSKELEWRNLTLDKDDVFDEVDLETAGAEILSDGDY